MKAEGSSKTPEIRQTSPPGAREDYEKSVRKAMTFIRPPHWEQVKGSTSYTLRIISAQPRRGDPRALFLDNDQLAGRL